MARHRYLIVYPNGIKRHVNRLERDLLASSLTQIAPHEYRAESLSQDLQQSTGPDFLEGHFTIEYPQRYGKRRVNERLETPKRMTIRLSSGAVGAHCKWNPEYARLITQGFQPKPAEATA